MSLTTIHIKVDKQAAQIYTTASSETKKKIQTLLSVWLMAWAETDNTLERFMDDMSNKAKERGLTPEILDQLL